MNETNQQANDIKGIKQSLMEHNEVVDLSIDVLPLHNILSQIKKRKRHKIISFVVKPLILLLIFFSVANIALIISDTPQVSAFKFKLNKVKCEVENEKDILFGETNNNYK